MTDAKAVSLIIPAYNEEKYIGACLDAVRRNIGERACEIIVVDNGSTDATAEIVAAYSEVKRVFEPAKGITRAREAGYRHARGEILAFIDADTLPPPGWFDQIEQLFAKHADLACLSGPYDYCDLPWLRRRIAAGWFVAARLVYHALGYMVVGGNFAIRRTALDAMGGFDASIEFYGDDADIARRARRFGRVLFRRQFVMPTSARRLQQQGHARTAGIYLMNFASIAWRGRPATNLYRDIR
jgi:glycosyltransferase involved in cell wall biosynthesis